MLILVLVFASVAIIILWLVFRKPIRAILANHIQTVLVSLLVVSLIVNGATLGRYLVSECFLEGGGQSELSPDGLYAADAKSLRPLLSRQPTHYLMIVESRAGQRIKSVRIDAGETNNASYFRGLPQIIRWSGDSKEVTFDIPGIRITMDHELHPW